MPTNEEVKKSFDDYIKAIQEKGKPVFILNGTYNDAQSKDNAKSTNVILGGSKKIYISNTFYDFGPYKIATQRNAFNKLEVGDTCIIVSKISNTSKIYTYEAIYVSPSNAGGKEFQTFSCSVIDLDNIGGGGSATAPNFTADPAVTVPFEEGATVTLNKQPSGDYKFNFKIPRGEKGPVGPQGPIGPAGQGGSSASITLPNNTAIGNPIKGDYGVNLIDYRKLSNNGRFGVNGRTLYSYFKTNLPKELKKLKADGYKPEYSGIKKSKPLKLICYGKTDNPNYSGDVKIVINKPTGDKQELKLDIPNKGNQTIDTQTIDNYGYYNIVFGADSPSHTTGDRYKFDLHAYYGGIHPERLDRRFVFKKYNGLPLLSNGTTYDTYQRNQWHDTITKKLNVCNLRDLKIHRVFPADESPSPSQNILLAEVPVDARVPERDGADTEGKKSINSNLMTNNLCEISEEGDTSVQHKPFFVTSLTELADPHPLAPAGQKKWYFQILLNENNVEEWQDLLAETQIIYEIKKEMQTPKPLRLGGLLFTLASGEIIRSCDYGQIDAGTTGIFEFKDSPYGVQDRIVQTSQITSITRNTIGGR